MAAKPYHQPLEILGVLWAENQCNMSPIGEVGKTAGGVGPVCGRRQPPPLGRAAQYVVATTRTSCVDI